MHKMCFVHISTFSAVKMNKLQLHASVNGEESQKQHEMREIIEGYIDGHTIYYKS